MKKLISLSLFIAVLSACTPTVKVEAPDKPIRVDLNVKIQQEVRVKIDRDLEQTMNKNKGIF